MELEVTHLAVDVFDFFLLVYCSPSCHRAEDVVKAELLISKELQLLHPIE
jgi:hypothetical protein